MKQLTDKRIQVYLFSLLLSVLIYIWAINSFSSQRLMIIRLNEAYSLIALGYLYLALLIGPFVKIFKRFPANSDLLYARRAIGICTFLFSLLHIYPAFFLQLGGFAGIAYYSNRYVWAIGLGFVAFIILGLLALTSFDKAIAWMGFDTWKLLHRFVYLAGIITLIHAIMLGAHFSDVSEFLPKILYAAVSLLLVLQTLASNTYFEKKVPGIANISVIIVIIGLLLGYVYMQLNVTQTHGIH